MTLLEHVWLKPIYLAKEGKRKRGESPYYVLPQSNRITFQSRIAALGMAKTTI